MKPVSRGDIRQKRSLVIAAHPDDEVLWFSSVLDKADEIVICFLDIDASPEISAGRRRCAAGYPLGNLKWLEIGESGCYGLADWRHPAAVRWGIQIPDKGADARYRENYERLSELLEAILPGYSAVYTHNPWGEYGHEEHVQVHSAVKNICGELPEEMRPEIWCPVYVSSRSAALMLANGHILKNPRVNFPTNANLASQLKNMYEKNGCWTWSADWQWPAEDIFILAPAGCNDGRESFEKASRAVPIQFITFSG